MTRRLDWHRTYPGVEKDYTAKVEGAFGRGYYALGVPGEDKWHWTASRESLIGNGYDRTPEEAIRMAEDALLGLA